MSDISIGNRSSSEPSALTPNEGEIVASKTCTVSNRQAEGTKAKYDHCEKTVFEPFIEDTFSLDPISGARFRECRYSETKSTQSRTRRLWDCDADFRCKEVNVQSLDNTTDITMTCVGVDANPDLSTEVQKNREEQKGKVPY